MFHLLKSIQLQDPSTSFTAMKQWFDIKISLCNIGQLSTPVRSSMG